MEKIKVNMSPNPLDVQTIHASQNDGEARQWEFELHNNGELIDTSDVKEQLVFKAYKGGTEQLLPENTSTPTTSPFKGDIRYPQGLLTDQEFTYRQSPTEEDGLARIKTIKGNTLVWNQLVPINWVSTRTFSDGLSVTNNNDGSYTLNGTATASRFPTRNTEVYGIQGHKYLIQVLSSQNKAVISQNGSTVYVYSSVIYTAQNNNAFIIYFNANTYSNEKIIPMIIDLTQMGLDITDPSDFTSLFPLSYYSYNQGSLLSFNGNGIKTVGFNQWDEVWEHGSLGNNGENTGSSSSPEIRSVNYIPILPNTSYYLKTPVVTIAHYYGSADLNNYKGYQYLDGSQILNIPIGTNYIRFRTINTYGEYKNDICLNISDSSRNGEYEPYTSSTLSLPISTYFPNGMKSAGNVYDELTESKAISRVGSVDLGTIAWGYNTTWSSAPRFYSPANAIPTKIPGGYIIPNFRCVKYKAETSNNVGSSTDYDKCISVNPDKRVYIQDSSFTDPVAFKESLSGVYLYYELATPTETSFTTASLVTENAEIPLSNNDGTLIGKCTEELSAEPGFHDAKIKLSDADGECYSNKIQLHVERSPQ